MKKRKKLLSAVLTLVLVVGTLGGNGITTQAANKITVDCNSVIREVTHCANGSLYGLIESTPSDLNGLVAPLNPYVFRNPARGGSSNQHPYGDAIKVAKRISGIPGAVVSIDLADMLPYWPYKWPGISGWLSQVRSFVNDKKASGCTNWYGYEIWNEPDGTFKNNDVSFEEMWRQTYNLLKSLDPNEKIIGPCDSWYNHSRMKSFLQYCKANNCLPDIISWHELSGIDGVSSHIQQYRNLEKELGIKELPISINEYCSPEHSYEGQPGASATLIGKFERYKVESACITWWYTNAPGRLGSLLATNTQKGAGWYFYKWYGEMTGNVVSVTPPNDNSDLVDGTACVDNNQKYISFIFGGKNDGTITTTIKNLPSFISSKAKVKIEKIDWKSKDTVSYGPSTVSETIYSVLNRSITVTMNNCNSTSGYRVYITDGNGSEVVSPTQPSNQEINGVLKDGWYYIKNTGSQKYLTVTNNTGKANQNIEISSLKKLDGQKWKVTNTSDGYITLQSALGNFMMDISEGKNANGTNVIIYNAYSGNPQKFELTTTNTNGIYALFTKVSNGTKALDVYENGTTDGSNVIQWTYYGQANQTWSFEPAQSETASTQAPTQQAPTQAPTMEPTSTPSTESGLKVTYNINNWGSGYQVNIKVENKSGSKVNTWTLTIPKSQITIDTSWNVNVKESGSDYVITPVSWNSAIENGNCVEFGVQGSGSIGDKLSINVK